MGYYTQFMARQAELTQSTMEQARKALLAEGEAEALYRQELEDQITDLQKAETALKKQLVKSGTWSHADELKYFRVEQSILNQGDQRRKERADLTFKINERATFDDSVLGRMAEDFSGSIVGGANADEVVRNVIAQAEDPRMGTAGRLSSLAKKAQQDGDASSVDYAMKLADFLEEQIVKLGGPEISEEHRNQLKAAAARVAGTPTRSIADVSPQSKQMYLDQETKELTGLLSNSSPYLLKKFEELKAAAADPREIARVQRAIEIKMETSGAQRAEIEAQLEALGRPMEVTEEAVRGRTQEMMEPYKDISPFPIASALAKRIQKRRGDKAMADFEDMDENSKIIYQNSLKAQQYLAEFGGQLPPEDQMTTIEWDRARDIMEKVQNGTLPKTAMVRIAQQFAEKDLGRGAPPTDVRRQRDEIIERVLMLNRVGAWSSESSVKPLPKPEPEPALGLGAEVLQPVTPPAGTGRGATTPASTTPSLPDDLVASAQRRKVFGEPPSVPLVEHGPEEAPTGSAVADVLVPPQNLGETSFAEQYPTSPFTTQSFQRPDELDYPRAPTDAEWDAEADVLAPPPTTAAPRQTSSFYGRPVNELASEYWAKAKMGIGREIEDQVPALLDYYGSPNSGLPRASMAKRAVEQFSQSQSMAEIPGEARQHDLMAQAAIAMGLPVPEWYRQATPQIAQR